MKAKEYLEQLRKLDVLIENKMYEKAHWYSVATSITAQSGGDRVQSSSSKQKMADAVGKSIDLEQEIDRFIKDKQDKRNEIVSTIELLNATEYDVLHKLYVQNKTFDEVAEDFERGYSWCTSIHGRALKNLQDILDEREGEREEEW